MSLIVNMFIKGNIKENNNKSFLEGKDVFNNILKIYFINEEKNNINLKELKQKLKNILNKNNIIDDMIIENKIENILNGKEGFIIKNALGKNDNFNCIFNNESIMLIDKNDAIINIDIKKKDNQFFKSSTIYDLFNKKDLYIDYSSSLNEYNNINIINRFFNIVENNLIMDNPNVNFFKLGIKELEFLKKLEILDFDIFTKYKDYEELKKYARKVGYNNLLKNDFFNKFYKLEEESILIDQFIKAKETNNFKEIKLLINKYGLENCPVFLNFKIKFNVESKELFKNFVIKNLESILNFYFNSVSSEIQNKIGKKVDNKIIYKDEFLKSLYLNNLIFKLKIPSDSDTFKVSKLYAYNNYNKRYLNNFTKFGMTSNLLQKIEEYVKNEI